MNLTFSIILILGLHSVDLIVTIIFIGCLIYCTCFVYIASVRTLLFSFLIETSIVISYFCFFLNNSLNFFNYKQISIYQLFLKNFYIFGFLFCFFFITLTLIEGMRVPFDYLECESELVAGLITEMSGVFFVLFSLCEINHILIGSIILATCFAGGGLISIKSFFFLFVVFIIPRAIGCRLKISNAHFFIVIFLNFFFFLHLFWTLILKFLNNIP